jgi:RNA polymerase sigma-70 factor (ECF subfamily)
LVRVIAVRLEPTPDATQHLDATLVARAAGGDRAALGALYDRHASTLLAVAFRLLMSRTDAEDVVHDVFVGLPEALRRYEERGAFLSWLKRVTVRVALSRLRHNEVRDARDLSPSLGAPARDHDAVMDLEAAVASLPPSLRAVLVLKEIEGYSHVEIGEMVGISAGASKVRLHRALRALRAMLEEPKR